jgi:hypothetical protein
MSPFRLDRLLETLTSMQLVVAVLWLGLALFTLGLAVLLYTRWGQYKPLRKCMAMSLLAHLLLAGYAATVEIVTPLPPPVAEPVVHVTLSDKPDEAPAAGGAEPAPVKTSERPWEVFANHAVAQPKAAAPERGKSDQPPPPRRLVRVQEAKLPGAPPLGHIAVPETKTLPPKATAVVEAAGRSAPNEAAATIEAPPAQRREAAAPPLPSAAVAPRERLTGEVSTQPARPSTNDLPAALLDQIVPLPKMSEADDHNALVTAADAANPMRTKPVERMLHKVTSDAAYSGAGGAAAGQTSGGGSPAGSEAGRLSAPSVAGLTRKGPGGQGSGEDGMGPVASLTPNIKLPPTARATGDAEKQPVPNAYRLRVAPNRIDVIQGHGGTAETEAAVKAALKWLADNQAADGHWDPRTHEAGKETNAMGRDRQGAGGRADTGITGLALLSFLGSGHTHLDGPYHEDVRRGLEYLMRVQATNGNLGGNAAMFEFMYCHAMATCALSEAYGMTRDDRLRESVERAIGYTLAVQDPKGGGWRYRPGDAGDTSQLGWQLMALKSAELAGLPVPERTRQGIIRYLQSVSAGQYGGRASYRPGEQTTRSMTAEALLCWQFLGLAREHPACNEAGNFMLDELPGEGTFNLYYWYYATFSMYQLQGVYWQRWNEALRTTLVSLQVKEGPLAGSWNTNDLWGGYGGRVYTTALAALTLEVYYRFLPLYSGAAWGGSGTK